MRRDKVGGLDIRITGGTDGLGGGSGPVVILLHGFGALGRRLVELGWSQDQVLAYVRQLFTESMDIASGEPNVSRTEC